MENPNSSLIGLPFVISFVACITIPVPFYIYKRPILPTIDPSACKDPVLAKLVEAFRREGILLILKDFSQGLPMPCVAALAHDPATFPEKSEIVFTAGTASSPAKAAIRAITEDRKSVV